MNGITTEIMNTQEQTSEALSTLPASVEITGIDIPIGDMMLFMIKWGFASIPVMILFGILWVIVSMLFGDAFNPYSLR